MVTMASMHSSSSPENPPLQTLGDLLRSQGIHRRELARRLGISTGKLFPVLNGRSPGMLHVRQLIAGALDMLPSTIGAVLDETKRRARIVAPAYLEMPEHLAELRAIAGMTQKALAKQSRIDVMTISKIESGGIHAHAATITRLARGLNQDVDVVRKACRQPDQEIKEIADEE